MTKRNKLILAIIAGIVVVTLAVVAIVVVTNNNDRRAQFESSPTVQEVMDLTTVNGNPPASVVIAPPTQEWWDNLLLFSFSRMLFEDIEWDDISEGVNYIAYTTSPGQLNSEAGAIGYPTTFLIYENEEQAALHGAELSGITVTHTVGNIVMLLSPAAYIDLDYAYTQIEEILSGENSLDLDLQGEAWWWVDFSAFETLYTEGHADEDVQVFRDFRTMLGVADNTTWFGTSEDGLNWDGRLYNYDPSSVAPLENIYNYLMDQFAYLLEDGSLAYGVTDEVIEQQTGVTYPRQSIIPYYMALQTHDESFGTLDPEVMPNGQQEAPPLLSGGDDEFLRFTMQPNPFLEFMMNEPVAQTPTWFEQAVISVYTDGRANLSLTPSEYDPDMAPEDSVPTETPAP